MQLERLQIVCVKVRFTMVRLSKGIACCWGGRFQKEVKVNIQPVRKRLMPLKGPFLHQILLLPSYYCLSFSNVPDQWKTAVIHLLLKVGGGLQICRVRFKWPAGTHLPLNSCQVNTMFTKLTFFVNLSYLQTSLILLDL